MTGTIEGGCLCGEVRYRIQGEPVISTTCQCRSCRKASAAAIVPWIHVEAASFSFFAGKPVEFQSSADVTRTFCGRCGTPLTYWTTRYGPAIDVTTASLDDPELFPPIVHVWTSHRLKWLQLADGLPCLQEGPPSE
ncbi:MAG TPA: GFA family protein [Candidatus Limnocylindrales bacterium]|nr:GFA family protein [Candidatus Limnocylindrales bacterium]